MDDILTNLYDKTVKVARAQYKPSQIKCLLIAESPPGDGRFFYFPNTTQYDFLFVNVMEGLFPGFCRLYDKCKDKPQMKGEYLCQFRDSSFYLHNVYQSKDEIPRLDPTFTTDRLIADLKELRIGQTPIIIIKAILFYLIFLPLHNAGFNMSRIRIPFPSHGNQHEFLIRFRKALNIIRWNDTRDFKN